MGRLGGSGGTAIAFRERSRRRGTPFTRPPARDEHGPAQGERAVATTPSIPDTKGEVAQRRRTRRRDCDASRAHGESALIPLAPLVLYV